MDPGTAALAQLGFRGKVRVGASFLQPFGPLSTAFFHLLREFHGRGDVDDLARVGVLYVDPVVADVFVRCSSQHCGGLGPFE